MASLVNAGETFFELPARDNTVIAAGKTIELKVSQMPDSDGKPVSANVYAEGSDDLVMTVNTWSSGSVSDDRKNNFRFMWPIPSNLCPGSYYVKIDAKNDQDDNDTYRSRTIIVRPSNVYQAGGSTVPPSNQGTMKCGGRSAAAAPNRLNPPMTKGALLSNLGEGSIL
jgi:hypothetical protein